MINKKIGSKIDYVYIRPENCLPLKEAISAIKEADAIVLGPGSLYTSIIPNLLVKGMIDEIINSKAIKIYLPNIMTQPGETDDFSVLDHVNALIKHTNNNIIDYLIVNTRKIPTEILEKYEDDGAYPVYLTQIQEEELNKLNINIIKDNILEIKRNYIRHDATKVSECILNLIKNT